VHEVVDALWTAGLVMAPASAEPATSPPPAHLVELLDRVAIAPLRIDVREMTSRFGPILASTSG
jgi:hypothetical protein